MANVPGPELSLEGHHMIALRLKRGHLRISACVLLLPQNSELRASASRGRTIRLCAPPNPCVPRTLHPPSTEYVFRIDPLALFRIVCLQGAMPQNNPSSSKSEPWSAFKSKANSASPNQP